MPECKLQKTLELTRLESADGTCSISIAVREIPSDDGKTRLCLVVTGHVHPSGRCIDIATLRLPGVGLRVIAPTTQVTPSA